jgi:hypothetical protein
LGSENDSAIDFGFNPASASGTTAANPNPNSLYQIKKENNRKVSNAAFRKPVPH